VGPTKTINLKITLSGIASIESNQIRKITTEISFEYRLEDGSDIYHVDVSVTITSGQTNNVSSRKRGLQGTALQSTDSSVEVTYTQMTSYRTRGA